MSRVFLYLTRMLKLIVFDFDGTIADSAYHGIKIINEMAPEFGLEPLTNAQITAVKDLPARKMIKDSGLPFYKLPRFVNQLQERIYESIPFMSTSVRIKPHLDTIQSWGIQMGILTSNSEMNVRRFLDIKNIDCFDFVYSDHSIFGKSRLLKKMVKSYRLKKNEVIYIGDEVRDIKACKKAGIAIIACSWGLNSKASLLKVSPEYLVSKPSELIQILSELK